jgi:hypothetical protein
MLSQSSSFYVTLPSNGSKDVYPNNKPNSYKNQFPRALQLDGEWEVALTELTYPGTSMSIDRPVKIQICIFRNDNLGKLKGIRTNQSPMLDTVYFELPLLYNLGSHGQIFVIGEEEVDNVESLDSLLIEIPVGKYTPKSLVEKFRQVLAAQVATIESSVKRPFHHLMELTFDEMKNRVCSESLHQVLIFYYQEDDASSLFGLPKLTDKKFSKEFHLGKYEFPLPPLVKDSKSLFIYTDIIDNDLVGDALVPLLRTVDILDDLDVIVHKAFDLSYYKRVIPSLLPSIEIQVNSETGALVNFESGEVICLLHFRKVSNKR